MMRSIYALNVLLTISGLSTSVAAQALTTITPCPTCPQNVTVAPIVVTAQYQPVATCVPVTECQSSLCSTTASCSTYNYVSTVITYLDGPAPTTITKTDQSLLYTRGSTVLTSQVPCPTPIFSRNVTATSACSSAVFQTQVIEYSNLYDKTGPLAIRGYPGSGLCESCVSEDETTQEVNVVYCLDTQCVSYVETWVSRKPTPPTSVSSAPFTGDAVATQSGLNTFTFTAVFTPAPGNGGIGGPIYSAPVTTNFAVTTSVPRPQAVQVFTTIIITFIAEPSPTAVFSESTAALSTTTFFPGNGIFTIPIITILIPSGGFTPVPTTVFVTTTLTAGGPQYVTVTTTVTVTFTSTVVLPPVTVIDGSTQPTAPLTTTVTTTETTITTTSTTASTTNTPEPTTGANVLNQEFVGCVGSSNGFPTFVLELESPLMDIDLCTTECVASGYIYSGVYSTECYCSGPYDDTATNPDQATGACNIPCPGDPTQTCGGNVVVTKKRTVVKRASDKNLILLDVYSYSPTTTTSSATETSTETTSTPEPSSDPDPAPVPRDINADMEIARKHKAREVKLRRGGMLRNVKSLPARRLAAKRDYSVKKPFGQ